MGSNSTIHFDEQNIFMFASDLLRTVASSIHRYQVVTEFLLTQFLWNCKLHFFNSNYNLFYHFLNGGYPLYPITIFETCELNYASDFFQSVFEKLYNQFNSIYPQQLMHYP